MTTVTFEAPDELAARFNADPSALPKLIREAVQTKLAQTRVAEAERHEFAALAGSGDDGVPPLPRRRWNRLLLSKSAPRQEERLEELLDRNGEAELTPEEQAELEKYLQYRHVMVLLKAAARRVLGQQPA